MRNTDGGGGVRENAETEKNPVTISLHLDLYPPPLIPLLAGQCLCSDLLKNKTKVFLWWSPRGQKRGSDGNPSMWALTVLQGWAVSGNVLPTLCHRYQHAPKAQFNLDLSAWPRQMDEQQEDYGEEEAAAWYLTKAMAASSLQNSSSTITPSRRVMWSILQEEWTESWEVRSKSQLWTWKAQERVEVRTWCPLALDLIISSSQAAVWVWSRGCAESSTWDLPPPNTRKNTKQLPKHNRTASIPGWRCNTSKSLLHSLETVLLGRKVVGLIHRTKQVQRRSSSSKKQAELQHVHKINSKRDSEKHFTINTTSMRSGQQLFQIWLFVAPHIDIQYQDTTHYKKKIKERHSTLKAPK